MHKDASWFLVGAVIALLLPRSVRADIVGPFLCESGAGGCNNCHARGYAPVAVLSECQQFIQSADSGTIEVLLGPSNILPGWLGENVARTEGPQSSHCPHSG